MGSDDFHRAFDKYGPLVREIQHETGLPDDAFGVTGSGDLLVEGLGMGDMGRVQRAASGWNFNTKRLGDGSGVVVYKPDPGVTGGL